MTPIYQNMSEAIINLTRGVKELTEEKSSPPICSRIEAAKRRAKPVLQRSQHLSRPAENGDRVRCNKPCRKEEEEEAAKLVATTPEFSEQSRRSEPKEYCASEKKQFAAPLDQVANPTAHCPRALCVPRCTTTPPRLTGDPPFSSPPDPTTQTFLTLQVFQWIFVPLKKKPLPAPRPPPPQRKIGLKFSPTNLTM